jgi:hypothetical protein
MDVQVVSIYTIISLDMQGVSIFTVSSVNMQVYISLPPAI